MAQFFDAVINFFKNKSSNVPSFDHCVPLMQKQFTSSVLVIVVTVIVELVPSRTH